MKKLLFLTLLLILPNFSFANCSISTGAPAISQDGEEISIEWMVKGACSDSINEFKAYYLDGENWTPITTVLAGKNKAKYSVKWDISEVISGEYKVRILQDGDTKAYSTSEKFIIDKKAPTIRNDVWLLPSGGEILKGDIVIKWNKDSISDDYKMAEKPLSFYYSLDDGDFLPLIEGFENSGIFVAKTSDISAKKVYLKIVAKDFYGNKSSKILEESFTIDNTPPAPAEITEINGVELNDENKYFSFSPSVTVGDIDINDENIRIVIFDKNTEKVFGSIVPDAKTQEIQLSPMIDGEYELKVLAIDSAGNSTESKDSIEITKDSFAPIAPTISYSAIVSNDLRVSVDDLLETGGELILMAGDKELGRQDDSKTIFKIGMIPQGIYNLYVLHKDKAGNVSDKSNEREVIFDTFSPKNVKAIFPLRALYGDFNVKISYVDNIGVEKTKIYLDGKEIGETSDLNFLLKTASFKNGTHKLKLKAVDFAKNETESEEFNLKIFNSLISGHWANTYIRNLFDQGVLSGEGKTGIIDPERKLNRASALKLISSFFNKSIDIDSLKKSNFSDVPAGIWYEEILNSAYKDGIIEGFKEKHKLREIKVSSKTVEVKNLQFLLKGLSYNLKITGKYDNDTIKAVANYQKSKGLKGTGDIGLNTLYFLNNEEILKENKVVEDDAVYFKPGEIVNRVQALKIILTASGLKIEEKKGAWYEKYIDFAKENGIMTGDKNGDLMLERGVTVGEMAKMLLKTKDLIKKSK